MLQFKNITLWKFFQKWSIRDRPFKESFERSIRPF